MSNTATAETSTPETRNFRAGGAEGRPQAKDRWRTPPQLYARLDAEFGFGLDAACDSDNLLADRGLCWDEGADGLLLPWHVESGGRAVWCNPPYSRIRPWVQKAVLEGRRVPVVLLVPADTSTRWWVDCVAEQAAEVRFVVGRIKFHDPSGTGRHDTKRGGGGLTTPSALLVYRPGGGPPTYSYTRAR